MMRVLRRFRAIDSFSVALLSLLLVATVTTHADVVDRIVAVVGGQAITASDVRAARVLGLVDVDARSDEAIIDRLIVRELTRVEVDRFAVAPGDPIDVEARFKQALTGVPAGPSATGSLDALGMTEARLRAWIDDDSRIERYLQQRFDVAAQPTDDEVLTYFQSREREFLQNGRPMPFASVQPQVRARLAGERRRQLIDEWVAGLRRRAAITVLPARE